METNIDPQEWRREVDRVEKLLGIPEYPELLASGSDSSINVNTNDVNDLDLLSKFQFYTNYFQKATKNKNIQIISNVEEMIDSELKKINYFENKLCSSGVVKESIDKIQNTKKKNKTNEDTITILSEKLNLLHNKLDDLNENLKNFNVNIFNF